MTWEHHVEAVKAQWIVRYLQPGEAAWKHILDEFILKIRQVRRLSTQKVEP